MLKSITFVFEESLLDQARLKAHGQCRTLNSLFRIWLERYVKTDAAPLTFRDVMKQLSYVKTGGRRFTREEFNER